MYFNSIYAAHCIHSSSIQVEFQLLLKDLHILKLWKDLYILRLNELEIFSACCFFYDIVESSDLFSIYCVAVFQCSIYFDIPLLFFAFELLSDLALLYFVYCFVDGFCSFD